MVPVPHYDILFICQYFFTILCLLFVIAAPPPLSPVFVFLCLTTKYNFHIAPAALPSFLLFFAFFVSGATTSFTSAMPRHFSYSWVCVPMCVGVCMWESMFSYVNVWNCYARMKFPHEAPHETWLPVGSRLRNGSCLPFVIIISFFHTPSAWPPPTLECFVEFLPTTLEIKYYLKCCSKTSK